MFLLNLILVSAAIQPAQASPDLPASAKAVTAGIQAYLAELNQLDHWVVVTPGEDQQIKYDLVTCQLIGESKASYNTLSDADFNFEQALSSNVQDMVSVRDLEQQFLSSRSLTDRFCTADYDKGVFRNIQYLRDRLLDQRSILDSLGAIAYKYLPPR